MRINEMLINGLMATRIFEMAFSKKVAIDKARNLQNQIAKHLVKMIMYRNSEYFNHWGSEVNGWLEDIQDNRLKGNNCPLNEKDLEKILLGEPLGTLSDVQTKMNRAYREYPELSIEQSNVDEVSRTVSWVLIRVCRDVSNESFTDVREYF